MRPSVFKLVILAFLVFLSGCTHLQLQHATERQATTLTDLQYRQVLDNLALFSQNAYSLPFYSLAGTGITSITNGASLGTSFNWDKMFTMAGVPISFPFDKASASPMASTSYLEEWTTASVLNPDQLLLMRCVYQLTVTGQACDCDCQRKVSAFFQRTPCYLDAMKPGWFCVGKCTDVPLSASYVGHYGSTFVWVMPENVDLLTKLTLGIIDIGTAIKAGEVGIIDPTPDQTNALIQKAKDLEAIYTGYPNKDSGEAKALLADLKNTVDQIEGIKYTPEQIRNDQSIFLHLDPNQRARLAEQIRILRSPPPPALYAPRERMNLYNPLQLPVIH